MSELQTWHIPVFKCLIDTKGFGSCPDTVCNVILVSNQLTLHSAEFDWSLFINVKMIDCLNGVWWIWREHHSSFFQFLLFNRKVYLFRDPSDLLHNKSEPLNIITLSVEVALKDQFQNFCLLVIYAAKYLNPNLFVKVIQGNVWLLKAFLLPDFMAQSCTPSLWWSYLSNCLFFSGGSPRFPTFSSYLYFLFCPTLIYRESYPR